MSEQARHNHQLKLTAGALGRVANFDCKKQVAQYSQDFLLFHRIGTLSVCS